MSAPAAPVTLLRNGVVTTGGEQPLVLVDGAVADQLLILKFAN